MKVTLDEARIWTYGRKRYVLFDTKRKTYVGEDSVVTDFRGDERTIAAVSRGPEQNGTGKLIPLGGWEVYATVFDLAVLPYIEPDKQYQLDVYNRDTMVRKLTTVFVEAISDAAPVLYVRNFEDGEREIDWTDVHIANEVGVDDLIPER